MKYQAIKGLVNNSYKNLKLFEFGRFGWTNLTLGISRDWCRIWE